MFCFQRASRPQSSIGAGNVLKWCASNPLKKLRSLTPEDHARENIDHQLESCGWVIHDMSDKAVMSVSLREYHSTNEGPEAKKRTGANTRPKRERVNQQIVGGKALAAGEYNKDEIEAISILYSRPYAARLRYGQVKELARRLSIKPFHICLLYTSPSPRDQRGSRMPSSA